MNKASHKKIIFPLAAALAAALVIALLWAYNPHAKQKVSEFGKYQGFSEANYDGNKRISSHDLRQSRRLENREPLKADC